MHLDVYISLSKVSWDLAKKGKGANDINAQEQRKEKTRLIFTADPHTSISIVGRSRELSRELNTAALRSLLCFSEAQI